MLVLVFARASCFETQRQFDEGKKLCMFLIHYHILLGKRRLQYLCVNILHYKLYYIIYSPEAVQSVLNFHWYLITWVKMGYFEEESSLCVCWFRESLLLNEVDILNYGMFCMNIALLNMKKTVHDGRQESRGINGMLCKGFNMNQRISNICLLPCFFKKIIFEYAYKECL